MEKLLAYINSLSTVAQAEFAARCGTTVGYLRKAISIGQRLGEDICIAIDEETGGKVACEDLRPDLNRRWAYLRGTCNGAKVCRI